MRAQASIALAVSTSQTASWKLAATSASGTSSPSRCRVSTQRATAVFSPENEKSKRCLSWSFRAVSPRGNATYAGSPVAALSMSGPPGYGRPSTRATLSYASPAASSMVEPSSAMCRDVVHLQQRGVTAGHQQRDAGRRQRAVVEQVHRDVTDQVVHPVERLVQRVRPAPSRTPGRPPVRPSGPGRR